MAAISNHKHGIFVDVPEGWSSDETHRVCADAVRRELARLRAIKNTADQHNRWLTEGVSDYLGYRAQDKHG